MSQLLLPKKYFSKLAPRTWSTNWTLRAALWAVAVIPTTAVNLPKIKPVEVVTARFALENIEATRNLVMGKAAVLRPGSEFVKLVLGFSEPVKFKSVAIETCAGEFGDGIDFMFHPGQRQIFAEGGKSAVKVQTPGDQAVRTLAIVFRHQPPTCVKGLQLLDAEGNSVPLVIPEPAAAKIETEELRKAFDESFHVPASFSAGFATGVTFEEPQDFDKLLLWTGDQLSLSAFKNSERLTHLSISADNGPVQQVSLVDKAGLQEVLLKKPLQGRKVTIRAGKNGQLSEMRFGTRANPLKVVAPFDMQADLSTSRVMKAFGDAGLADAVDHELSTRGEDHRWNFRFRSDSSFFIYGFNDGEARSGFINAMGRFEVISANPKKIKLRLVGSAYSASSLWDGFVCGIACGDTDVPQSLTVDETIVVEKLPAGIFMVRNRNTSAKRALLFTDLKSKVSTLSE